MTGTVAPIVMTESPYNLGTTVIGSQSAADFDGLQAVWLLLSAYICLFGQARGAIAQLCCIKRVLAARAAVGSHSQMFDRIAGSVWLTCKVTTCIAGSVWLACMVTHADWICNARGRLYSSARREDRARKSPSSAVLCGPDMVGHWPRRRVWRTRTDTRALHGRHGEPAARTP